MQESVLKMCPLLIAWTADRLFSTGAHRKKCIFPLEWRSRQPSFDCARPCFHTSVPKWISCVPVQGGLIHFEESELKRKKKEKRVVSKRVAGFDIQKADDVNNREWSAAPLQGDYCTAAHSRPDSFTSLARLTNSFFCAPALLVLPTCFSKCGKSNDKWLCCALGKKWYSWQKRAKETKKEIDGRLLYGETCEIAGCVHLIMSETWAVCCRQILFWCRTLSFSCFTMKRWKPCRKCIVPLIANLKTWQKKIK